MSTNFHNFLWPIGSVQLVSGHEHTTVRLFDMAPASIGELRFKEREEAISFLRTISEDDPCVTRVNRGAGRMEYIQHKLITSFTVRSESGDIIRAKDLKERIGWGIHGYTFTVE